VQLHPYIIKLIAEDRIAEMHAQAELDQRARTAARERRAAKRQASRGRVLGHRVPAHPAALSARDYVAHPSTREDKDLVSVGRAGSDDCI